jgi:hypothetical protein
MNKQTLVSGLANPTLSRGLGSDSNCIAGRYFLNYRSYTARNGYEAFDWTEHMPEFSQFLPLSSSIGRHSVTGTSSFFQSAPLMSNTRK